MSGNIEKIHWNPNCEWVYITTEYGKFISFNLPRFNYAMSLVKYQPIISNRLRTNEYDLFVDVGAYCGWFSFIATKHCQAVVAYEANPFFFGILLENTKFFNNVKCKYGFVGNESVTPRINPSFQRLVSTEGDVYNIPVRSLDDEIIPLLHDDMKTLIKVDVEANEIEVMKGARELAKNRNIHWCIDVHVKENLSYEDITCFFDEDRDIKLQEKFMEIY